MRVLRQASGAIGAEKRNGCSLAALRQIERPTLAGRAYGICMADGLPGLVAANHLWRNGHAPFPLDIKGIRLLGTIADIENKAIASLPR